MLNNIESIQRARGIVPTPPTQTILESWGITLVRYNKIVKGKIIPTIQEAYFIAEWLDVDITTVFPNSLNNPKQ